MAAEFALVFFDDQQMYRTLRIELILSLSESSEFTVGSLVDARLNENSNYEKATLVHIGSYDECDSKRDTAVVASLKSIPDPKSNKMATKFSRDQLATENSELKSKMQKLSNQFDNLQAKFQNIRDTIVEKDREISSLKILNEELEEKLQLSISNELLIDSPQNIQQSIFGQLCDDVSALKYSVGIILEKLNEITPNPTSSLASGKIFLAKGSTILVSRNRFVNAKGDSVTSFVRKIFTAVFEYEEVIGATLTGLSRSGTKRKSFESENTQSDLSLSTCADASTPKRARMSMGKALPKEKVAQFIEAVQTLYPGALSSKIKSQITFKLSKINGGEPTKNDFIDWSGFNEDNYNSLFPSVTFEKEESKDFD